jgi:outer membrane protein OmpA-like peptidoglycan-associated protein
VLIDNRFPEDHDYDRPPGYIVDIPPPVIDIPPERYIIDLGTASDEDIRYGLLAPPVQELERPYTLEEVLHNEEVRAYSPRLDLDTITFDFGSATIGNDQMAALFELGEIMEQIIAENPAEVYLIEGHADKVGTDYDNLILSDERAEAVAVALSQNFAIPPENLVTEGYGEQYPKVNTEGPERRNRRATIRRLTELLQAQAQ